MAGAEVAMSIEKPEIHAIEVPRTELTVDYRASDGAIVVTVAREELLCLYPNGFVKSTVQRPFKKLYEAIEPDIKALHDWMVRSYEENVKAGNPTGRYVGLKIETQQDPARK